MRKVKVIESYFPGDFDDTMQIMVGDIIIVLEEPSQNGPFGVGKAFGRVQSTGVEG